LVYWPAAVRFLVVHIALSVAAVAVLATGAVGFVYSRLELSPDAAVAVLVALLPASQVNIPLRRLPATFEAHDQIVRVVGVPFVVRLVEKTRATVVAINVGGCRPPLQAVHSTRVAFGA
jgi:uncharacterized membrane protein